MAIDYDKADSTEVGASQNPFFGKDDVGAYRVVVDNIRERECQDGKDRVFLDVEILSSNNEGCPKGVIRCQGFDMHDKWERGYRALKAFSLAVKDALTASGKDIDESGLTKKIVQDGIAVGTELMLEVLDAPKKRGEGTKLVLNWSAPSD